MEMLALILSSVASLCYWFSVKATHRRETREAVRRMARMPRVTAEDAQRLISHVSNLKKVLAADFQKIGVFYLQAKNGEYYSQLQLAGYAPTTRELANGQWLAKELSDQMPEIRIAWFDYTAVRDEITRQTIPIDPEELFKLLHRIKKEENNLRRELKRLEWLMRQIID